MTTRPSLHRSPATKVARWLAALAFPLCATAAPLVVQEQGSFAVGGTVVTAPGTYNPVNPGAEGQTLHGDHAYVFYQVPEKPRKLPLVMWHGAGQSSKTWERTPEIGRAHV